MRQWSAQQKDPLCDPPMDGGSRQPVAWAELSSGHRLLTHPSPETGFWECADSLASLPG